MRATDDDWELLNAYADGELDRADREALNVRLQAEPALRRELERVSGLKHRLSRLKPQEDAAKWQPHIGRAIGVKPIAAAAAAALALVAVVLLALTGWPRTGADNLAQAFAIHDRLSHAAFLVEESAVPRMVSSGYTLEFRAPDLTASRLFLVDVETRAPEAAEAIAMHYRGLRGCRLTIVAIHGADDTVEQLSTDRLARSWTYGGFGFVVVANGMDRARLASIATFVKAEITDQQNRHDDLKVAMGDRYAAAQPCA